MLEKYKSWVILVVVIVGCVFGVATINKYIENKISIQTAKLQEQNEKDKAVIQEKLSKEKFELENELKTKIINLETEYQKCKIAIEANAKKQEFKEMSKKDPKRFKKELEETLGVKGKSR